MKTIKVIVISSLIVTFALINLTIAFKFSSLDNNKWGLISLFHSAVAGGEDCWFCPEPYLCYYNLIEVFCPPGSQNAYYSRCTPQCEPDICLLEWQTECN